MLILHKNIKITLPDGTPAIAHVEEWGRGGTKSPTTYVIQYGGKRYAPYAQVRLGYSFTLNGLFKLVYNNSVQDLVYSDNPFLKLIPKDESAGRIYHKPVKLGV